MIKKKIKDYQTPHFYVMSTQLIMSVHSISTPIVVFLCSLCKTDKLYMDNSASHRCKLYALMNIEVVMKSLEAHWADSSHVSATQLLIAVTLQKAVLIALQLCQDYSL